MVLDAGDNVHILFATSLGNVYYAFGQVPEAGTLSLLLLGALALCRRMRRREVTCAATRFQSQPVTIRHELDAAAAPKEFS